MHELSTAVVGASGYAGLELTRYLARHPRLRPVALYSDRWSGETAGARLPLGGAAAALRYLPLGEAAQAEAEVAFLATPAEVSLALAPQLLARGLRVVDLSGAFRLADPGLYPGWYGFTHAAPELLAEARYGLPELGRAALPGARLVANPGCYATAIALALAPLLRSGLVLAEGVAVAAMSGVTGAGRKASEDYSFCEVDEDLRAYRLGRHQHVPEIEQTVARFAGRCGPISFTPHLVPIRRGILASCTLRLAPGAEPAALARAYDVYAGEPFLRVLPADKVAVKDVARTNRVHLGVAVDARAGVAVAVSAIDNLVKGAAGQAVQALNAVMGWDEALGLDLLGG
ncbi:N-acetyl-gamma-glutamyl-phosphate reductase [Anaeromyxobacter diazotrophicus]|uniref:N-acetyl-gamma-glutamyl-phosphate reductase n=1 Tax=Anaeromyxobacter diazotrophicus TaxID=2590199 RepID=A0A7I9VH79_9BACT|nr:N-acetyl-gamma-glutamyl-phosphate reductase [Anaeromyxobacter diazotrophicus]GEJ55695.1 N-acetyl-gamma-glutamyl-phosphate reductase [Anaeromyxobacter diazotrophicus]